MGYFNPIKIIVMDVDGTLTDGKIYMGDTGEMIKAFDIKDGYGIKEILPKLGIIPVLITARESDILMNRCKELDILELHQGIRNKIGELKKILSDLSQRDSCSYSLENVAYIGDDILDIQCMKPIKEAGGLAVCPCDAARDVIDIADFISTRNGGDGAVREFIEWLAMRLGGGSKLDDIKSVSQTSYDFIVNFNLSTNPDGKYDLGDGMYANVMSYITRESSMTSYETHQTHIDIQYMLYGTEIMMTQSIDQLEGCVSVPYNEENDVKLYNYNYGKINILNPGDFIILYPNDAHRGAIAVCHSIPVRKIVIKVPVK